MIPKKPIPLLLTLCLLASSLLVPVLAADPPLEGSATQTVTVAPANAQQILARLEQANNIPQKNRVEAIELLESEDLNAATDGQKIYFTTALWNLLKTDDQRAFVIAHEQAHVELNHVTKSGLRRLGLGWLNKIVVQKYGEKSTWVALASQSSLGLLDRKFSRKQEYGADDLGLQLMDKAGYNTGAAMQVFRIFEQSKAGSGSDTPEFLRSHPLDKSRIERLSKKYQLGVR